MNSIGSQTVSKLLIALLIGSFVVALFQVWAPQSPRLDLMSSPRVISRRRALDEFLYQSDNATFDYIVVGAGPGGGVTASHLASKGFRVLLLVVGGYPVGIASIEG